MARKLEWGPGRRPLQHQEKAGNQKASTSQVEKWLSNSTHPEWEVRGRDAANQNQRGLASMMLKVREFWGRFKAGDQCG